MKQMEFIKILTKSLKENSVSDVNEIIEDYNDHFEYKLLDGYTEEEISRKLGDPQELATQYESDYVATVQTNKVITYFGLSVTDFFAAIFIIILCGWIIVSFATSLVSLAIFGTLFTGITPFSWFPTMPYWCGAIISIWFLSFFVLMLVVTYYSYLYLRQLIKALSRFNKNSINQAQGNPILPSVGTTPILNKKTSRVIRKTIQLSLSAFAISLILGFLVCWIVSGNIEFWHAFGWFM